MSANSIGNVVEKYTTRLDKVIEQGACTAELNLNQELLGEYKGNGKIEIASVAMDGLADHVRGGGFVRGGASLTWDPYQMRFDRSREFSVDVIDDEEREMLVSANLMAEFARTKVVPEVDAVRFATIHANAGNVSKKTLTSPDDAFKEVLKAEEAMQDVGANLSDCILYHTGAVKTMLRQSQSWRIGQGESPNGNFQTFDEMKMRPVPGARFYTAVDLLDGVTKTAASGDAEAVDETPGGYRKADGAKNIQFIVMHPSAVAALTRHEKMRYFAPDVNQRDDAHLWQYRLFHDLLVYLKKKGLIYSCCEA